MTSSEYFRSLKILSVAMISGIAFFIGIALFLNFDGSFGKDSGDFKNSLLIVAAVFFIGSIAASFIFYRKKIEKLKLSENLIEKMSVYRSILIVKLALIEGPSFLGIVSYLLTSEIIFIFFGIAGIVFFILAFPAKEKIKNDLELNPTECMKLDNPDEIICELNKDKSI